MIHSGFDSIRLQNRLRAFLDFGDTNAVMIRSLRCRKLGRTFHNKVRNECRNHQVFQSSIPSESHRKFQLA